MSRSRRRIPLREGNSSRQLPAELNDVRDREAVVGEPEAEKSRSRSIRPVAILHVVQFVNWCRARFACHPDAGYPQRVFRSADAAAKECERRNAEYRLAHCPLELPSRGTVPVAGCEGYSELWTEDNLRLIVLRDYVQDLGLPGPDEATVLDWSAWWRENRPGMESWQIEAIWNFLDREVAYRVSEIPWEE